MFRDLFPAPALMLAAAATVAAVVLTGLAVRLAGRWRCLDEPDGGRKDHDDATPVLGGIAIFGALLVAVVLVTTHPTVARLFDGVRSETISTLLLSAGGFCLLGLWDDLRPLTPLQKFGGQILAALPFAVWGQPVETVAFLGWEWTLGLGGVFFTVLWLTATANVVNLIDGLDGLAGTVGLIACVAIAVVADARGFPGVSTAALVIGGAVVGFLSHNLPPARIFLGDSGSLLIGFLIGALSILSSLKTATGFAMAVPLILLSVPAFDTAMAIVRRRLTGVGIGTGDRHHIHHRLRDRGLSPTQTLIAIATLSAAMAVLCVIAAVFHNDRLGVLLCGGLLAALIVGRIFGHHETLLAFSKLQTLAAVIGETAGFVRRVPGVPGVSSWEEMTAVLGRLGADGVTVVAAGEELRLAGPLDEAGDAPHGLTFTSGGVTAICVGGPKLARPSTAAAVTAVLASALESLDVAELTRPDAASLEDSIPATIAFPDVDAAERRSGCYYFPTRMATCPGEVSAVSGKSSR